jgi:tRNA dimethylallyltransferase
MTSKTLVVILGATGTGKTSLSIELAKYFDTHIISADSRQLFKEMPIGSAAPNHNQLKEVKHHFIGSHSVHNYYNAGRYEEDVIKLLEELFKSKNICIMCGGSGMYIDAVCRGIDYMPEYNKEIRDELTKFYEDKGLDALLDELKAVDNKYYSEVDKNNVQRILRGLEVYKLTGKTYSEYRVQNHKERKFNILKIGLKLDREILYERINSRVDIMIQNGLEEEAKKLYPFKYLTPLKTIGYRELFEYFDGTITREKAIELIKRNSRHYARRQITWFKRYKDINWFEPSDFENMIQCIENKQNN